MFSDALGCFSAVQRAGCFHQPFVTGGGPDSAQHPALPWVNTVLGNIKRSLHGSYHHVSSKHLPRYLAEFSYRFNRRFSLPEMFPRLVHVALRTPPMPTECSSWLRIMRNQEWSWPRTGRITVLITYQAQLATAGRRKPRFRRSRNDVSGGPNVDSRSPESHRGRLRFVSAARLSLVRNQVTVYASTRWSRCSGS